MSKNQLIVLGLAVAFIILLVCIGVVAKSRRRRNIEANRDKADQLRTEGDQTRLQAEEQAANAAMADARARQARVAAEKLEREATARAQDAEESRGLSEEHHRRAMELDPDHDDDESNGQRPQQTIPADDRRY